LCECAGVCAGVCAAVQLLCCAGACAAVCAGVCRCVLVCRCVCCCVCKCVHVQVRMQLCAQVRACAAVQTLECVRFSAGSALTDACACVQCVVTLACARSQSYHGAKRTTTRRLTIHAHCFHPFTLSTHAGDRGRSWHPCRLAYLERGTLLIPVCLARSLTTASRPKPCLLHPILTPDTAVCEQHFSRLGLRHLSAS
jgi:hypothetical protein